MLAPLRLIPDPRERVWGGTRFPRPAGRPVGELWIAGPWTTVASGAFAGRTLEDVAAALGPDVVGSAAPRRAGPRFPLLAKLLDPAAWLSVQVHPDDATARRLAGPDAVGKMEAWYVVAAEPGAEILVGTRPDVSGAAVREAIRQGAATTELLARRRVTAGDSVLLPAGTLHAVGPGVLLYEVQQPSDLTYRVDDWGRPPSAERPLHTAEALEAVDPSSRPEVRRAAPGRVLACEHFALDLVAAAVPLDPGRRTLHAVTAAAGGATLAGVGWRERLEELETLVVPAAAGLYELAPDAGGAVLVASLP